MRQFIVFTASTEHGSKTINTITYTCFNRITVEVATSSSNASRAVHDKENCEKAGFHITFYTMLQFGSKLFIPILGTFLPLKLLCYSWPRCGSLTCVAINRTTGYQLLLICFRCMWFHVRIGQNGIGKIHFSCIGALITRSKTVLIAIHLQSLI